MNKIKNIGVYIISVLVPLVIIQLSIQHYQNNSKNNIIPEETVTEIQETEEMITEISYDTQSQMFDLGFMTECVSPKTWGQNYDENYVKAYCACVLKDIRYQYSLDNLMSLSDVNEFYQRPTVQDILVNCAVENSKED